MPRLFVGLELPEAVTRDLSRLRGGLPGARWIDPVDYHLTLRFIGDIGPRIAREIEEALAEIERPPFDLRFSTLGVFGGDKPHTLYIGLAPSRPLNELQANCERALRRLGLPSESRKFTPHITLARLRASSVLDIADYLASHAPDRLPGFSIERFALFSARETFGGGPYIVEAAFSLSQSQEMEAGWAEH